MGQRRTWNVNFTPKTNAFWWLLAGVPQNLACFIEFAAIDPSY